MPSQRFGATLLSADGSRVERGADRRRTWRSLLQDDDDDARCLAFVEQQLVRGQRQELLELVATSRARSKRSRASAKRPRAKRLGAALGFERAHLRVDRSRTSARDRAARPSSGRAVAASTARPARARSRRSRRPPSGCRAARSRCRAATPRGTGCRRGCCGAGPPRCACPRARASRSAARHVHVVALARRAGSAPACARRRPRARSARGRGARPTCRRARRAPRAACRRGPSRAPRSFAAGSSLIGICAAMPPIACAPRRWQVLIEQLRVGAQEGLVHRDLRAVGQDERRVVAELLDEAEDVVPAAAVEAGGVLAQLVEDLVHLERGGQRLDEHGRLDRARAGCRARPARATKTSFQSRASRWLSSFGQVEVRPACRARRARARCGRSRGRSRRARPGTGLPSTSDVLLRQVQPRGRTKSVAGLLAERVLLARRRVVVADRPRGPRRGGSSGPRRGSSRSGASSPRSRP